jgi:hypothetical protein
VHGVAGVNVTVAYPLRRLRIVFSLFSSIVRDVFFQFSVHILLNNSLVDVQHELFTNRSMQSVKNIVVVFGLYNYALSQNV